MHFLTYKASSAERFCVAVSFMALRRNIVDYSETEPVSPSHTVVQLADRRRRPRKRDQNLSSVENVVVDCRSPRPASRERSSLAVESRVTDPAGWAVTETSPSPGKTEGDPAQCQPLRMRRARAAWSDDALNRCAERPDSTSIQQNASMYHVNSGLSSDDDVVDERSVANMLAELRRKIEASESRLSTWKDVRAAAERDAVDARQVYT